MSRNNQDRLGAVPQGDSPAPTQNNPQLQFVVPTEFVELPSEGLLYPEGHPLHGVKEVEIKYMTAKEEDILADKTLLRKGTAIDKMMANIIVDKRFRPHEMLSGDRTAIMIAARKSAYGPEYETKVACPNCGAPGAHSFNLDNVENRFNTGKNTSFINNNGYLQLTLPKTGATVEVKFMVGSDEQGILQNQTNNKRHKLPENTLVHQLRTIIHSVNGNDNFSFINSFIEVIPAFDSKFIRKAYADNAPTAQLKEEYVCGECGTSSIIDVPFTTDFFWPK